MYVASNGIKTAVILRDTDPYNPRYDDNLGKMIAWHRRYNLGDKHSYETPDRFAEDMSSEYVSDEAFFKGIRDGAFELLRLTETKEGYAIQARNIYTKDPNNWETEGYEAYTLTKDFKFPHDEDATSVREDLMGYCSATELLRLCDKSGLVALLPLYLYDHSGLAMSTGSFIGRAPHADWDSGQVGFIYMDKDTAMRELAVASDKLRIAAEGKFSDTVKVESNKATTFEKAMEEKGYLPVRKEDILNADEHSALGSLAENGRLFKKDRKLFSLKESSSDSSFFIDAVATFNPNLEKLQESNWKEQAIEILEAEVNEYDNYLQGEVYGYKLYEGLDEVESCWGFNPGSEDIRNIMRDELSGWFGSRLEFEYDSSIDDNFDIEEYYSENDFPALRESIRKDVVDFITFEQGASKIYPFGMSAEDILSDTNGCLDRIETSLYDEHTIPDTDTIYAAIENEVGMSREAQAKITTADLDPLKDYTEAEVMNIFKEKRALNDIIAGAKARQGSGIENSQRKSSQLEH